MVFVAADVYSQVLEASLHKTPLASGVADALPLLADALEGFSGADLKFVCERAVQLAVRDSIERETMERECSMDGSNVTVSPPRPLSKGVHNTTIPLRLH